MIDQARLNRIKWRARRGLLENDIVLEKFFAQHTPTLNDDLIAGLDELLELSDNELMDLIIGRKPLEREKFAPQVFQSTQRVLGMLQAL